MIRKDPKSDSYISLSNDVIPRARKNDLVFSRNHLSLVVSEKNSIEEWDVCIVLLRDDTGLIF